MANPLKQLEETLKLRRHVQRQIDKLDALLADGTITQGHYDSTISDYRSRLKAVDRALADVRSSVRTRLSQARRDEDSAVQKLGTFQSRHREDTTQDEKSAREEAKLQAKIEKARLRRAELERAIAAESPAELRPSGETEAEEEYEPFDRGPSAEFPGVSVPERLFMLFREARNPEAKRPIAVSGIVLAVLTVIVLGTIVISAALADDTGAGDIIGRGEILVPVLAEDIGGVGRVSLTVEYDEAVLTATEVIPGVLARARTLTSDVSVAGEVSIEVFSTYGFDPAGELVLIAFSVDDVVPNRSDVMLSGACAFERDGGEALPVETEQGWVDTMTFDVFAPVLKVS